MKKLLTLFLLSTFISYDPVLSQVLKSYKTFNPNTVQLRTAKPDGFTRIIVPTDKGDVTLLLTKNDISPNIVIMGKKITKGRKSKVVHYQGTMEGVPGSWASVSLEKGIWKGTCGDGKDNTYVIGKIYKAQGIYNSKELIQRPQFDCKVLDAPDNVERMVAPQDIVTKHCPRFSFTVDYDQYKIFGSVANTTNFMTLLFNQMQMLYHRDSIDVTLSEILIHTVPDLDTASSTYERLMSYAAANVYINGDIGICFGAKGYGGVAWLNTLCTPNARAYVMLIGNMNGVNNGIPVYSWNTEAATHEIGHNFGSEHTHACAWNGNKTAIDNCGPTAGYGYEGTCTGAPTPTNGGTIMSYCHLISLGINFNLGFGQQPRERMIANINRSACVTNCGTPPPPPQLCDTVKVRSVSSQWQNSFVYTYFKWQRSGTGAGGFVLRWRQVGTSAWQTSSLIYSDSTYLITSLNTLTQYEWQLQTVCAGGNTSFTASQVFTTTTPPAICTPLEIPRATNITATTADVGGYSPDADTFNIAYRKVGVSYWTTWTKVKYSYMSGTNKFFKLAVLDPNTNYEWKAYKYCKNGLNSPYFSPIGTFTTSVVGDPPKDTCKNYLTVTQSPSGNVCAGNPVTFTATPTNTTGNFSWYVDGIKKGTGTVFNTSFTANAKVYCVETAIANCTNSVTSNVINVTLTSDPVMTCIINYCTDYPTTYSFTAKTTNATSPVFSWLLNGIQVATSASYSATLKSGDRVKLNVTGTGSCGQRTAMSNEVVIQ